MGGEYRSVTHVWPCAGDGWRVSVSNTRMIMCRWWVESIGVISAVSYRRWLTYVWWIESTWSVINCELPTMQRHIFISFLRNIILVIMIDCIGRCKSNWHTFTTAQSPPFFTRRKRKVLQTLFHISVLFHGCWVIISGIFIYIMTILYTNSCSSVNYLYWPQELFWN